jgi:hypothetical protein
VSGGRSRPSISAGGTRKQESLRRIYYYVMTDELTAQSSIRLLKGRVAGPRDHAGRPELPQPPAGVLEAARVTLRQQRVHLADGLLLPL